MSGDLMKLFSNRRTARLVTTDDIPENDIQLIKQSILLSPSLDKKFPYKVIFLTNSEKGKKLKESLITTFRCLNNIGDPWNGSEILQPILSGLTIVFIQKPTPLILDKISHRESEINSIKDLTVAGTMAMLMGESLGYATAMFGSCSDPKLAASLLGFNDFDDKVRLVITIAKSKISISEIMKNTETYIIDRNNFNFNPKINFNNEFPTVEIAKNRELPNTTQIFEI